MGCFLLWRREWDLNTEGAFCVNTIVQWTVALQNGRGSDSKICFACDEEAGFLPFSIKTGKSHNNVARVVFYCGGESEIWMRGNRQRHSASLSAP